MATQCTELHDSEIAAIWYGAYGEAVIIFSYLYIHESEGEAGVDSGIGWYQRAELVIENAEVIEFVQNMPWNITAGKTEVDGVVEENGIPMVINCRESFKIWLAFFDDNDEYREIEFKGSRAELNIFGKKGWTENFPGTASDKTT